MHSCLSVKCEGVEPNSVLDNPRSPSTCTSTSTDTTLAALSAWPWAADLQPMPDALLDNIGMEDWEDLFDNKLQHLPHPTPDFNNATNFTLGIVEPFNSVRDPAPPGLFFPVTLEEKPQLQLSTFLPDHTHSHQALLDQLLHAAELVEAGNSISAIAILARLNHQLPSPTGKPLLRSAYYFKEALHRLTGAGPRGPATALDVLLKLGAYKAFSEVSPFLQFTNFTCTQALLEEVRGADRIHIVDFDVGVGGQWASFIKELADCRPNAAPTLKITAFVSVAEGAQHPFELHLTRDNLYHFAASHGIPFEFTYLDVESFDPAELVCVSGELIAVNLPAGAVCNPPIPSLLRLVKQLSPRIVVSVDRGCNRSDLPFAHYFLHSLQSSMVLLDSIDASGTSSDVASKIERCLLQPRIEEGVIGRHRAGDRMPPWRMLFASAGFLPVHFSNFTEAQAECLIKRMPVRGFHVEKRHASMFLHWQHRELASVSAWRC